MFSLRVLLQKVIEELRVRTIIFLQRFTIVLCHDIFDVAYFAALKGVVTNFGLVKLEHDRVIFLSILRSLPQLLRLLKCSILGLEVLFAEGLSHMEIPP